jgi:hypothetical protein
MNKLNHIPKGMKSTKLCEIGHILLPVSETHELTFKFAYMSFQGQASDDIFRSMKR